jgi:hypothetical protein
MKIKRVRLLAPIPGEDPVYRPTPWQQILIVTDAQAVLVHRSDGSGMRLPLGMCAIEYEQEEPPAPSAEAPKSSRPPEERPRAKRRT